MITLVCPECFLGLRTVGEHDQVDLLVGTRSDWYPDRYPCPQVDCKGKMTLTDAIESMALTQLRLYDLTPHEVFAAIQGLGLPEERDCGREAVLKALVGHTIVAADVVQVRGLNRSILHSITLESGQRVYLAASPVGSSVYRIAGARSFTQEVLSEP
jgi:hypothetical protein